MTYLGTFDLPIDTVTPYPGNPRQGNVAVIEESLRRHGQYRTIVVRPANPAEPMGGGTALAGNHTWMAARNIGMPTIRAELHDVDDDTARRIVAVDNRAADMGDYDDRLLAELLQPLDDLAGTGYDETDLETLAKSLTPPTLEELADEYGHAGDGSDEGELWPRLSIKIPPVLMAAWRSHLDTHMGDEVEAFAGLLDVDMATL